MACGDHCSNPSPGRGSTARAWGKLRHHTEKITHPQGSGGDTQTSPEEQAAPPGWQWCPGSWTGVAERLRAVWPWQQHRQGLMPLSLQRHGLSRTRREAEAQQQCKHEAAQPAAPAATDAVPAALGQLPSAAPLQQPETELGPAAPTVTLQRLSLQAQHQGTTAVRDTGTGREMPARNLP